MPRDLDNYHPEYPKIIETLTVNPFKAQKEAKKKKGKKIANTDLEGGGRMMRAGEGALDESKLRLTEKCEYKVFEFGNYPLRNDGKPLTGQFRMMLPCDADWAGFPKEEDDRKR